MLTLRRRPLSSYRQNAYSVNSSGAPKSSLSALPRHQRQAIPRSHALVSLRCIAKVERHVAPQSTRGRPSHRPIPVGVAEAVGEEVALGVGVIVLRPVAVTLGDAVEGGADVACVGVDVRVGIGVEVAVREGVGNTGPVPVDSPKATTFSVSST